MSKLFFMRPKLTNDSKLQKHRDWSSETDLHRLPPLSKTVAISPRISNKRINGKQCLRPPTPSPNMSLNNNGKPQLAPLSPSSSKQRLNLATLREEISAFEGTPCNCTPPSPRNTIPIIDSPRMRIRSLPSSPRSSRQSHAIARRLNSEPDYNFKHSKDDRIMEWVRDVQRLDKTMENDDVLDLSSASDCSDLGSSPTLPVIQENSYTVLSSKLNPS